MFEQSFVDLRGGSGGRKVGSQVFSFTVQGILMGFLILLPMVFTDALPRQQLMSILVAPPPPPPAPPPPAAAPPKIVKVETELDNGKLKTPTKIPEKILQVKDEEPPPDVSGAVGVVGGVVGGAPGGTPGGVLGGIISSAAAPPPVVKAPTPQRIRVSQGVTEGNLVRKVTPVYPQLAKTARIQGTVILTAVISKDGSITGLKAVQGPPMLYNSAIDAVRQWRYKPYFLNGEPVEVETTITVNFSLTGG